MTRQQLDPRLVAQRIEQVGGIGTVPRLRLLDARGEHEAPRLSGEAAPYRFLCSRTCLQRSKSNTIEPMASGGTCHCSSCEKQVRVVLRLLVQANIGGHGQLVRLQQLMPFESCMLRLPTAP